MSDLGLLCFYLGVEMRQDATAIALRQTHYAKRILELGSMTGCNPAYTDGGEAQAESGQNGGGARQPFSVVWASALAAWSSLKTRAPSKRCTGNFQAPSRPGNKYPGSHPNTPYVSRMLAELLGRKVDMVELKVDSKSDQALTKNSAFHKRSKHIRIKYHFIRDCLEDGSIKASHIATTDQLADILTKSLGKSKFQEMRERIGPQQNHLQCSA
ncbi:uncharacterized protein [Miscanthus floridulus]|uniref:uncharacterized protein n=1 Tax=Miscanthus floridulus TaxID=154761 RepID=UPI00345A39DA